MRLGPVTSPKGRRALMSEEGCEYLDGHRREALEILKEFRDGEISGEVAARRLWSIRQGDIFFGYGDVVMEMNIRTMFLQVDLLVL